MSRLPKNLPLILAAIVTAILATTGCGGNTSNDTQIRMVNAVPDSQPVDIYMNGGLEISALPFGGVTPDTTPVSYLPVPAGRIDIQGFVTGSQVNPVSPTGYLTLNPATQYTMVAVGLSLDTSPPSLFQDDNLEPVSGNEEYRIINASINTPAKGVDVYIVPPGTDISLYTPNYTALSLGQQTPYQQMAYTPTGYEVIVTPNVKKVPRIVDQVYTPSLSSITTLVVVDNAGGTNGISPTPIELNDLN
jgi:hypothetical protein